MPTPQSWLARVALCVAVALSSVVAAPAFADTQAQRQGAQAQQKTKRLAATPAASISTRDLQCLSEALYFEARGEGAQGQRAVAETKAADVKPVWSPDGKNLVIVSHRKSAFGKAGKT